MNVLLTSVGRRAYMVKYFKNAVGESGKVYASNSDDKTSAFNYADGSVITPLIYDEKYIPFLLDYCKEKKIDILVSLFDIDLPVLAGNKEKFAEIGTKVIVSDRGIINICNDKWKTYTFLKENGFAVPKTYLSLKSVMYAIDNGEMHYPVVVKPRFGCGSIALSIAEDEMALLYYFRRNTRTINKSYLKYESAAEEEKIIYQEMLPGEEYGADIINDLDGNTKAVNIRKKVAMRAGETDIAELCKNEKIESELVRLGRLTRHIANMDVDIFFDGKTPYILEMNARFGGGYPFSHMGGCDLPQAIVNWVKGDAVPDEMLKSKTGIKGYKEIEIKSEGLK